MGPVPGATLRPPTRGAIPPQLPVLFPEAAAQVLPVAVLPESHVVDD